jgi:molybdate transport system permease protein
MGGERNTADECSSIARYITSPRLGTREIWRQVVAWLKVLQSDKVFTGVTYTSLIAYGLFVVAVVGSILIYTSPGDVLSSFLSEDILFAIRLSLMTSVISTALALLVALPAGYCLSRFNFRGKTVIETLIDLPIVLPPLIVGMCLLIFFNLAPGRFIESHITKFVFSVPGIVLAQFSISASFAVLALRASFDSVDQRYEEAARTLGCTKTQAFFKVTLPLIRPGFISGGVMVWTRAVGEFVPILLLCGAQRGKTYILPIAIFVEFELGAVGKAAALTIVFLVLSVIYLSLFRRVGLRAVGLQARRGLGP